MSDTATWTGFRLTNCKCETMDWRGRTPSGSSLQCLSMCRDCTSTMALIRPGSIGAFTVVEPPSASRHHADQWDDFIARWKLDGPLPADIEITLHHDRLVAKFHMLSIDSKPERGRVPCKAKPWDCNNPVCLDHRVVEVVTDRRGQSKLGVKADSIALDVDVMVPTALPCEASALWIRAILRWMYVHELDEWIRVNDVMLFDPHDNKLPPTPENS